MGDQSRTTPFNLNDLFSEKLTSYSFFQVMRLLECAYKNRPRFGQSLRPVDEAPIRLGQEISLAFAPSTLSSFTLNTARKAKNLPPILRGHFLGLFGSNGPLPLHLTEYVNERIYHHRDHTLAGFADMFHHRMLSLFYRAYANTEPTVSFDRPESDVFAQYVGSLAGFGDTALRDRDAMPDLAKFHYTGYLSCQNKHAEGLRAMLADYFGLTVSIEQFVGEWLDIQETDLTKLGDSPKTGELGISAILGSRVWACQHKFRVRFDALTLSEYVSLLPNGDRIAQLVSIVRNYLGDEFSWDVSLVLQKQQVPRLQLGESAQLGWTTWLGERNSDQNADDLKLNPFWGRL